MSDQFFGLSDTGRQRKNNEDNFIAQLAVNGRFIIACVIDGVGGYAGGEVAAKIARDTIIDRLKKPAGDLLSAAADCLAAANEKIVAEKRLNSEYDKMSCVLTLALVDVTDNQCYYAHVGDTRLYLLRDNSLIKISHDQSFVGFLEESGRLTEEEAMSHPKRNEINRALGFEMDLRNSEDYIETGQSPFLSGDMLLLCSDGLTDMIGSGHITEILTTKGSLKEKGTLLVDAANVAGGRDNITVVLVQNDKTAAKHVSTKPVANIKSVEIPASKPQEAVSLDEIPDEKAGKSNSGATVILTILTLIFLATTIYLYLKAKPVTGKPQELLKVIKLPGRGEIKLQQLIDSTKGHVLVLTDSIFKDPVTVSNAIVVNNDTLFIKTKGKIVLKCDSGYHGPAFRLTGKCKSLYVDSLTISGFSTGISVSNNALELKNVRFVDCPVGVQNQLTFTPNKPVSWKMPLVTFKTEALPSHKNK